MVTARVSTAAVGVAAASLEAGTVGWESGPTDTGVVVRDEGACFSYQHSLLSYVNEVTDAKLKAGLDGDDQRDAEAADAITVTASLALAWPADKTDFVRMICLVSLIVAVTTVIVVDSKLGFASGAVATAVAPGPGNEKRALIQDRCSLTINHYCYFVLSFVVNGSG